MKYEESIEAATHTRHIHIEIEDSELVFLKLDEFDQAVIDDCKFGTIADKILALQTVAFRLEQQQGIKNRLNATTKEKL